MDPDIEYTLYYPHPVHYSGAIVCVPPTLHTRMDTLVKRAQRQSNWDLGGPYKLYRAEGLSLTPDHTLLERSRQWLQEHHHDPSYQVSLMVSVQRAFPEGSNVDDVDILVVNNEILESLDTLVELDPTYRTANRQREKNLQGVRVLPSPSVGIGDFDGIRVVFDKGKELFHTGRPYDNYGPPVALFNPALGLLVYHLHHLEHNIPDIEPDHNEIFRTHSFIQQSLRVFESEEARGNVLKRHLPGLLGSSLDWKSRFNGILPGFVIGVNPWVVGELKNELGLAGDASLQAALSYSKIITSDTQLAKIRRERSNNPAILIGIMGDLLEISIAVCTDGVYVDRQFSQRLRLDYHQDALVLCVARAFKAVKLASAKLETFYATIDKVPHPTPTMAHFFPSPVASPSYHGVMPELVFKSRMCVTGELYTVIKEDHDKDQAYMRQSKLYLATMTRTDGLMLAGGSLAMSAPNATTLSDNANEVAVVVKFTTRYHAEAHRILSDAGLAPALYSCAPVCDRLYMVVMDHIHGKTAWSYTITPPLPDGIYEDVEAAITLLHSNDLVFGDLRMQNIMCIPPAAESGTRWRAMLVDFDWVGKDGHDMFPAIVNHELADWECEVRRRGVMTKAHDLAQLEGLKRFQLAMHE